MEFQERAIALAIFGIVFVFVITGLILMLSEAKTGNIVTYKYANPNICYGSEEEACARNLHCTTYGQGVPVDPRPPFYPQGFAICRCPNQADPYAYKTILMCA